LALSRVSALVLILQGPIEYRLIGGRVMVKVMI
jgi:hypothetical protein